MTVLVKFMLERIAPVNSGKNVRLAQHYKLEYPGVVVVSRTYSLLNEK